MSATEAGGQFAPLVDVQNDAYAEGYRQGIADFVSRMSAVYRRHSGDAVREDILMAVAHFGVSPASFYADPHEQEVLRAEADLYRLTGKVRR